jgi:N utilization substance protein B
VKSKFDPRHQKRISLFKYLFTWESVKLPPHLKITPIVKKISDIDAQIAIHAPKWPVDKINRVDLSVLRLAIWELLFSKVSVPPKVIIDEAIEIGKEYGNESSGSFINAVLGSILKDKDDSPKN